MLQLPQYPQPSRWQELKDIIRDYSGGHVRKSDTIPPHHKTGFATIPGLEHAYLAFRKSYVNHDRGSADTLEVPSSNEDGMVSE